MPVGEESSRCGIEAVESSAIGAKPERAGPVFADCGDLVIRKAVGILGIVPVKSELPGLSIQPVEAILGPDPKESLAILLHGPDHVVTQAVRIAGLMLIVDKRRWLPREPAQSALGTHPHHSFRIFEHGLDGIVGQTVRIVGIFGVADEFLAIAVQLKQSPIHGAQPKRPIAVFKDAVHAHDALAAQALPRERNSA